VSTPGDLHCTLAALATHPIKSCAGVAQTEALLVETGLQFDRQWMIVDEQGEMLTQRELPRMALIECRLKGDDLVLRAPGMLALHLSLDHVETATRVRVWDDEVRAYDMGALAGQWASDFLAAAGAARQRLRIVRFDPEQRRLSEGKWTGTIEAENAFSDGFPILVASSVSLAELNRRLLERGAAAVDMRRFRPNLVLDGLEPFDEDHIDELHIDAEGGPVVLKLVKPCTRCSIPGIDPDRGEPGAEPGHTLAGFRADARMGGAVTFGMNAVILRGIDSVLRVGQAVRAGWAV
jgi:uncharacterized protein